jgi:hypothetical protein
MSSPRYVAYFLYNGRGKVATEHVVKCELPEGVDERKVKDGFWIDDNVPDIWDGVKYIGEAALLGTMWVPPGRITSVLSVPSSA